jgi:hypothetical protein
MLKIIFILPLILGMTSLSLAGEQWLTGKVLVEQATFNNLPSLMADQRYALRAELHNLLKGNGYYYSGTGGKILLQAHILGAEASYDLGPLTVTVNVAYSISGVGADEKMTFTSKGRAEFSESWSGPVRLNIAAGRAIANNAALFVNALEGVQLKVLKANVGAPPSLDRSAQTKSDHSFDSAKEKCLEIGFTPATETFGKCVLQLSK